MIAQQNKRFDRNIGNQVFKNLPKKYFKKPAFISQILLLPSPLLMNARRLEQPIL